MTKQKVDTTPKKELSFTRHSSFATRFKTFLLNYKYVSTTNWVDKLAEVYGNFAVIHLDEPFDYPFMRTKHLGYLDVLEFMNRAGNALKSIGVKKGERVLLITGNRVELGLLNFACHKIEAVPVPVNYMYKTQEIKSLVEDSGARVLITDNEVFANSIGDRNAFPSLRECLVLEDDHPPGCSSLGRMMEKVSPDLEPARGRDLREVVQIFYSSGTTGTPKGALLSRRGYLNLIGGMLMLGALAPGSRRDLLVTSLPLAHIMGMALFIIRLASSTPWYFVNRFDPERILSLIQKKRATSFIGVPAMYSMLLNSAPQNYDLRSVLLWGSAADAMPPELMQKLKSLNHRQHFLFPLFLEAYGQVETGGITSFRLFRLSHWSKSRSVSVPFPTVKVRVVGESGETLPRGKIGELEVKSPMVTMGYWNQPEANQKAFHGRWFRTGDLAIRRRIGLEIVGRKSERIKCGGYSIFPQEVEEELLLHPEIMEAAVMGIPDPRKGQIPVAAVVIKPGSKISEEKLLKWVEENIAGFKRPRMIKCLPEMPRGATQKVLKKELETLFIPRGEQGPEDASPAKKRKQ